jgi:hypothetical protein
LFKYRFESLKFCLNHERPDEAQALLRHVFRDEEIQGEQRLISMSIESIYEEMAQELTQTREKDAGAADQKLGYCRVLSDPMYRGATYMVMAIAFFNQFSGVNFIGIYSNDIFTDMQKTGSSITPSVGSAYLGIAQFVGCCIAPFVGMVLGLKKVFVVGQLVMGVCLLLVAIFTTLNNSNLSLVFIIIFDVVY